MMPLMRQGVRQTRSAFCTEGRRRPVAGARRKRAGVSNAKENGLPAADKIARLLALIVTKDMDKDAAALQLDGVGFDAREISDLLRVNLNYVNVAKHRTKRRGTKRTRSKR